MLDLKRRAALEGIGTAVLVATVIGSGIMAERLAQGNVALALLCNTVATAGALLALIAALGPLSGAHFNPMVTAAEVIQRTRPVSEFIPYVLCQFAGGIAGAVLANLMFGAPAVFWSQHERSGSNIWLGEVVATFGLLFVVFTCARAQMGAVPFAVAGYITAAYWFTSSTSFANPAVTVGRAFSDSFAGIRPIDVPGFLIAQCIGSGVAIGLLAWIFGSRTVSLTAAAVPDGPAVTVDDSAARQEATPAG